MNILSYQFFCEGCARDEWRTAYVNTIQIWIIFLQNHCLQGINDGGLWEDFYIGFNRNKVFVGSGLEQVPDATPCIWFRGFQIYYWVAFSQDKNSLWGLPDTTSCIWFWGFQICYWVTFSQDDTLVVGSALGEVPDTTPCLWFWGFQICYWVRFSQGWNLFHWQWL